MSDRPTLTSVMLGIDKHGLVDRLTEQCFTFLIGLILEANRLRFKNPFDLTLNQTMAAGGGDSRQTVSRRRKQLSKYKIDGKPIMTYTAGNKSRNTTATYTIDYNLLCSYNGIWQGQTDTPSQMWDRSATEVRREADSSATILRSDQKREEENSPRFSNVVSRSGPPQPEDENKFNKILDLFENAAPGWCIQNDIQRQKLIDYCEVDIGKLGEILEKAGLKGVKGDALFSWVDKGIKNYDVLYAGGNSDGRAKRENAELALMQKEVVEQRALGHYEIADTLEAAIAKAEGK